MSLREDAFPFDDSPQSRSSSLALIPCPVQLIIIRFNRINIATTNVLSALLKHEEEVMGTIIAEAVSEGDQMRVPVLLDAKEIRDVRKPLFILH